MVPQTTLFSFPFVSVRPSLDLLTLILLVMGMKNEENFGGSLSRTGSLTGGDDHSDRNKIFGKANVQVLCMRAMSRLFYKHSLKLVIFP